MQRVMTRDNVSVILSAPRATLREKMWGGMRWWTGAAALFTARPSRFYPRSR